MTEHNASSSGETRRDHACLLFSDRNAQKRFLLSFLQQGLEAGEHCNFVCPQDAVDDWLVEMRASGIDVIKHQASGGLGIITGEQWRATPFNSITRAREMWKLIDQTLTDFPAMRIAFDASWANIDPVVTPDRLCHWEATADLLYEDLPVKAVCFYDLDLHSPSNIRAALRTHHKVVLDSGAFSNPYYEPDRILANEPDMNNSDADDATIGEMLGAVAGSYRT